MIMSNRFSLAWQLITGNALIIVVLAVTPTMRAQGDRLRRKAASHAKSADTNTSDAKWYLFRGPDKDFHIRFPVMPARAEDVQGPVTMLRRYTAAAGNVYFEISIQDMGGAPDSLEANEFDPKFEQQLSALLTMDGFRIVQLRRTAKNIYEMEAWSPAATPNDFLHNLVRGVIHKGRNYRMGCNSLIPGREVNKRMCRRFFDSFRVTDNLSSSRDSKK
jgi:hypothetical protein